METTTDNAITLHIHESGVEPETGKSLKDSFLPFFEQAEQWKTKAEALTITDVSQVREMKMAREARLALKDIRVNVEKKRKELKEDSFRKGKAIDGIANVIKYLIEPIEAHLEEQEKFAEIREAKRKAKLKEDREAELLEYEADVEFIDLSNMPEEAYQRFLESAKLSQAQRIEAERKATEERIAREKAEAEERERIKVENTRLKKEAEEREMVLAQERAKAERERKEAEQKARAEKEAAEAEQKRIKAEQDAILKKEQEERKKAEDALREKEAAETKRLQEEAEAKLKAEQEEASRKEAELHKGDKQKLLELLTDIGMLKHRYKFTSARYQKVQTQVNELLSKIIVYAQPK